MRRAKHWFYDYDPRHKLHCLIRVDRPLYGVRFGNGRLSGDTHQDIADTIVATIPLPEEFLVTGEQLTAFAAQLLHDHVSQYGHHSEEATLP